MADLSTNRRATSRPGMASLARGFSRPSLRAGPVCVPRIPRGSRYATNPATYHGQRTSGRASWNAQLSQTGRALLPSHLARQPLPGRGRTVGRLCRHVHIPTHPRAIACAAATHGQTLVGVVPATAAELEHPAIDYAIAPVPNSPRPHHVARLWTSDAVGGDHVAAVSVLARLGGSSFVRGEHHSYCHDDHGHESGHEGSVPASACSVSLSRRATLLRWSGWTRGR